MLSIKARIQGVTPLIQSRRVLENPPPGADREKWEHDHFMDKAHIKKDGTVFVPGIAMKRALEETARLLGMKRKGMSTWTKMFLTGLSVHDIVLDQGRDDMTPTVLLCDSTGKKGGGGGTQVIRVFPTLDPWSGVVQIDTWAPEFDDKPEVIETHMRRAGLQNGVGSFRSQTGGPNGRWSVESFEAEVVDL